MSEHEMLSQLHALDAATKASLQDLFRDQIGLLRFPGSVFFLPSECFLKPNGASFRFRDKPGDDDLIQLGEKTPRSLRQPALVKNTRQCIKTVCDDGNGGPFHQVWVPLRRRNDLEVQRERALYSYYRQSFKRFAADIYGLELNRLPPEFFDSFYNVDHVVPSGWLLKPLARRGTAPDPQLRKNDPAEVKDATERGEIVEYVSLMLVPSTVNQAWGAPEGRKKREMTRRQSLGGVDLKSIAKVLGILPASDKTSDWERSLIVTAFDYGLLESGECEQLLADVGWSGVLKDNYASVPRLSVNGLTQIWYSQVREKASERMSAPPRASSATTRDARCFTVDGNHLICFEDPDFPDYILAKGTDLEKAKGDALVSANKLLTTLGKSTVVSLRFLVD